MTRRSYSGNAPATTLNGGINSSTLTIVVTSATGYPAGGGAGPFFIVIDRGLAAEEKILVDSISGATFTVNASGRGADGTTAATHSTGAIVEHVFTKTDADEANAHVNDVTTDVHPQYTTTAELATHSAAADPHGVYALEATAFPVGMGVWTDYTPTLTQSGAVTKTLTYARYTKIGRSVICEVYLDLTGAGTGANPVIIGLPVTAAFNAPITIGTGEVYDASVTTLYRGVARFNSTTTVVLHATVSNGTFPLGQDTFTAALASGDVVTMNVVYEAAT